MKRIQMKENHWAIRFIRFTKTRNDFWIPRHTCDLLRTVIWAAVGLTGMMTAAFVLGFLIGYTDAWGVLSVVAGKAIAVSYGYQPPGVALLTLVVTMQLTPPCVFGLIKLIDWLSPRIEKLERERRERKRQSEDMPEKQPFVIMETLRAWRDKVCIPIDVEKSTWAGKYMGGWRNW